MGGIMNALNAERIYRTIKIIVQPDAKKHRIYKIMKNFEKREKQIMEKLEYGTSVGLAIMFVGFILLVIGNVFFR